MFLSSKAEVSRAVFWSILMKDQRHFTFFVHSFNHIKGFQTKVEWCCTTLPLCTETPGKGGGGGGAQAGNLTADSIGQPTQ